MRRVSSRQRLVSWDAFEATIILASDEEDHGSRSSDNDDDSSDFETAHSSSPSNGEDFDEDDVDVDVDVDVNDTLIISAASAESYMTEAEPIHHTVPAMTSRKRHRAARKKSRRKNNNHKNKMAVEGMIKTVQEPPLTTVVATTKTTTIPKSLSAASMSSFATAVPTLVPGYSWEFSPSPSKTSSLPPPPPPLLSPTFDTLMADIHLDVFAFCDLASLRTIMSLNRHYRRLVKSDDAQSALWFDHCRKKWNNVHCISSASLNNEAVLPYLTDHFRLPTAAAGADYETNLALLLSLTPDDLPTGVDQNLLNVQRSRRSWRLEQQTRQQQQRNQATSLHTPDFVHYHDATTGLAVVQYRGPIGAGDRCIRSDRPLPRCQPVDQNTLFGFHHHHHPWNALHLGDQFMDRHRRGAGALIRFLRRGAHKVVGGGHGSGCRSANGLLYSSTSPWKPFVMPFVESLSSKHETTTVNVTPRFVSYYEVRILEKPQDDAEEAADANNRPLGPPVRPDAPTVGPSNDCVAVGVATASFHVHSRMPGWDRKSYGYHGDDGGIFHSSGGMVKQFGPQFGPGDTIGCGIDYAKKGIFFTLNGTFLGYGWEGNVEEEILKNDMYPVVGVDTNCPVHLNLGGDVPFAFDLASFIVKDEEAIVSNYRWLKKKDDPAASRRGSNTASSVVSSLSSSNRSLGASSHASESASTTSSSRRRKPRRIMR